LRPSSSLREKIDPHASFTIFFFLSPFLSLQKPLPFLREAIVLSPNYREDTECAYDREHRQVYWQKGGSTEVAGRTAGRCRWRKNFIGSYRRERRRARARISFL
jgi:hypothetical protein